MNKRCTAKTVHSFSLRLLCVLLLVISTPATSILPAAAASQLQTTTQPGLRLIYADTPSTGAFTIRAHVKIGQETETDLDGIWMAGLAKDPGSLPLALTLTWSPIANGWFGPAWGLQLATSQHLILDSMAPKHTDGFLSGYDYINLMTATPEWGHEYESTLGYTPKTGAVSVSVTDLTTGASILRHSLQLSSFGDNLYPTAGFRHNLATQTPSAEFESLSVQNGNIPLGLNWWVTQKNGISGSYGFTETADRRLETAILIRSPWQDLPGQLRFSLVKSADTPINLLTISHPLNDYYYPISVAGVDPAKYAVVAEYNDNGQTWELDKRNLLVGQVSLQIEDVKLNNDPAGSPYVTGKLVVQSDGPIENLVTGVNLNLVRNIFSENKGAGFGTIRSEQVTTGAVLNQQILQFREASTITLPLRSSLSLPADASDYVWQAVFRPFTIPDTNVVTQNNRSISLGKPLAPEAWTGFLQNEQQTKMSVVPGVDIYTIKGSIAAGPLEMFLMEIDLNQPGIEVNGMAGKTYTSGSAVRWPRSQVSKMVTENGAIAGVNSSFFVIDSTMVPRSMLLRSNELLRSPGEHRGVLGISDSGKAYIGEWQFAGEVRKDKSQVVRVAGINPMSIAAGEAGLYRSPWLNTPGNKGTEVTGSQKVVEIVLQDTAQVEPGLLRGRVSEVRINQTGLKLNPQTFVITGRDAAADKLAAAFRPGDVAEVAYTLEGTSAWPWLPTTTNLRAAASGGVVLVKNGVYGDSEVFTDPARHPRTAAAVSYDRSKLYLLVVDGRSKASVGMTYRELAEYFLHMGAFEALNLDGGGSSTLSFKLPSFGGVTSINTPSDGAERYVSDGIGVFYHPSNN